MAKKIKKIKKSKKNKKVSWGAKIFKYLGLSFVGIIGVLGVMIGGYALFGGFNKPIINLTNMEFEQQAYVLDGNISNGNGIFDNSIKLVPTPEDANKLDITLSGGTNIVTLPTGEDAQVNKNLNIKLEQITTTNPAGELTSFNKGGEFKLIAVQEEQFLTKETMVYVETKTQSFDLYSSINNNDSKVLVYPGSKFTVRAENIFPAISHPNNNEWNKPSQIFYDVYGQDYFTKKILYFSSNENIATVNINTGEVTVLTEGEFEIFAYMPTTFKNNSLLPIRENCNSDQEYFDILTYGYRDENGVASIYAFTISNTLSCESSPINVSGITATANSYELQVNNTYSYVVNGINNSANSIYLDFALQAPQGSNYTNEQLNYKLQDIELFEGYKDVNGKFFISKGQYFDENNILHSEYFNIKQSKNPLYYNITPIDYTALQDFYLIARISDTKLDTTLLTETPMECIEKKFGVDTLEGEQDNSSSYVYYAYIKVSTDIVENEALNLKADKLIATFSSGDENKYLINANYANSDDETQKLNLNNFIESLVPNNATYKEVRFFVKNNGTGEDAILANIDENGQIIFENENYFVKANKAGTVKIYACIVKTDWKGNETIFFSDNREITLVVTEEIVFSNFNVDNVEEYNIENTPHKVTAKNGNSFTLTFDVAGDINGLDAFFDVSFSIPNVASANINALEKKIVFQCISVGSTLVTISFNGQTEYTFLLDVLINELKSIQLSSEDPNVIKNNIINFNLNKDSDETVEYLVGSQTVNVLAQDNALANPLSLNIELDGGNDSTQLYYYSNVMNNNIVEINIIDKKLKITPKLLHNNIKIYVYSVVGNKTIKSQELTINIVADYKIVANKNVNNQITLNGIDYEKVIGNNKFTLKGEYFTFENTIGESVNSNLFEISSNDTNICDPSNLATPFKDCEEATSCIVSIKPKFEDAYYNYYFYVLPSAYLKTNTIILSTGETESNLSNYASFYIREYAHESGEIVETKTSITPTFYLNKDCTGANLEDYTASSLAFDKTAETIYCKISYNEKEYIEPINIIINSTLNIVNSNGDATVDNIEYLNNGGTYELTKLFTILNGNVIADGITITKVTLTEESYNILKENGFIFKNSLDEEIAEYNKEEIAKITIPNNINKFKISGLTANIKASSAGKEITKENHSFEFNLKLSKIVLNESYILNNKIYSENNIASIKENFVLSASTNTLENGEIDASSKLNITVEHGKVKFTLNSFVIEKDFIVINGDYATQKLISGYIAKAYSLEELINLNNSIKQIENIYNYVSISQLLTSENVEVSSENYSIENKHLIVKTAGTYKIKFIVLGKVIIIENFIFANILPVLENSSKVYTNSEYNIFGLVNFDKNNDAIIEEDEGENYLYIINNLNLNVSYKLFNEDGITELSEPTITIDSQNSLLKIGNYLGQNKTIVLQYTLNNTNFTGVTNKISLNLHSISVTTNFTEVYEGAQVVLNKFTHNLKDYFTFSSSDNSLTPEYYYSLNNNEIIGSENLSKIDNIEECLVNVGESSSKFYVYVVINDKIFTKVTFFAHYHKLDLDLTGAVFYVGQTLTKEDIMPFVKLTSDITGETSKYYNIIEITFAGDITEYEILSESSFYITTKLGDQIITKSYTPRTIVWTVDASIDIYNGTQVSNYVTAKVQNTENYLTLTYSPVESDNYNFSEMVNNIYTLKDNLGNSFATLNAVTGDLIIFTNANWTGTILVTAKINETSTKDITFIVKAINKPASDKIETPKIYVGENTTDLTKTAVFKAGGKDLSTEYRLIDKEFGDENVHYTITKNNLNNTYELLKDINRVAYISGNNFVCTNNVDGGSLTVRAYLNITSVGNYNLVSLEDNFIEFNIELIKIEVILTDENGAELPILDAEGEKYYYVKDYENLFNIIPKFTTKDGNNLTNFTSLIFSSAFTAKVDNLIYQSKIYDVLENNDETIYGYTNTNINLYNSVVLSLSGSKESNFSITSNKPLLDNTFITLTYTVNSYVNVLNIALLPEKNITFNYDNNKNYETLYSPSVYDITNGTVFAFKNIDLVDNFIAFSGVPFNSIYNKELNELTYNYGEYSPSYGEEYYSHKFKYTHQTQSDSIAISKVDWETSNSYPYYALKLIINGEEYFYIVKIDDVTIEIFSDESLETPNSESAPIIIGDKTSINLLNYIKINDSKAVDVLKDNESFKNNLKIVSGEDFVIEENFTINFNKKITETIQIEFTFFNKNHIVYLKGDNISIEFDSNNISEIETTEDYYIYGTKTETNLEKVITIFIVDEEPKQIDNVDNSPITIKNLKYNYSGNNYNDAHFDIINSADSNSLTIKFGGLTLLTLTKVGNYYKLNATQNISGNLSFDITIISDGYTQTTTLNVVSEEIVVNYIEPSVKEGKQYQNILKLNSEELYYNLSNLISGVSGETYNLLTETSKATISQNGVLTINDINEELFLTISVVKGGLINEINVRVIPEYLFTSLNSTNTFTVLKNETIDLTNFATLNKFIGVDANNEPLYERVVDYKVGEKAITTPNAYEIAEATTIKIFNKNLTFNVLDISFDNQTCYIGETINLKDIVTDKISSLTLKNKAKISFEDVNGFISNNGDFVASKAEEYSVNVIINNVTYTITIVVNDLKIIVDDSELTMIVEEQDNMPIGYINLVKNEEKENLISLKSGENDVEKLLDFAIEFISGEGYSSENVTYTTISNETIMSISGLEIFKISGNKITATENINSNIKIKVNISVKDNIYVNETLYFILTTESLTTETNSVINYENESVENNVITENGVKMLKLYPGETLNIGNGFFNEGVDITFEDAVNVTIYEKMLTANDLSVTTYGYFDFSESGKETIYRVYVKIEPIVLINNYEEDYSYSGDTVSLNDKTVLSSIDKFNTWFIETETKASEGHEYDLSSFVNLSSQISGATLNYELFSAVYFNGAEGIGNKYSDASTDNVSLSNNILTLTNINNTYYIKIKVSYILGGTIIAETMLNFRVLNITMSSTATLTVNNNDVIDLTKIISVVAENKDETLTTKTTYNFLTLNKLNLSLSDNTNSYIKDNKLYIKEDKEATITLSYFYKEISNTITITVNKDENSYFKLNNVNYIEKFAQGLNDCDDPISLFSDTDNVSVTKIVYNNTTFIPVITTKEGVTYYTVDKSIQIDSNGNVMFYDAKEGVEDFVNKNNNYGVIYVSLLKTLDYGYIEENYKINNYTFNSDGTYVENGIEDSNNIRYSLVNELGLLPNDSVVSENTILLNGLTLNILTGETSGSYGGCENYLYVKSYLKESNLNKSEKFDLKEIYKKTSGSISE